MMSDSVISFIILISYTHATSANIGAAGVLFVQSEFEVQPFLPPTARNEIEHHLVHFIGTADDLK